MQSYLQHQRLKRQAHLTASTTTGHCSANPSSQSPSPAADGCSDSPEEDKRVYLVDWEKDDPENPRNWDTLTRFRVTILIVCIRFIIGFASSANSLARTVAADAFGVSEVVESMATAMFLFGLGLGALLAGPLSETFGRNAVYITTLVAYMGFVAGSATAPNIGAQLGFRFLAGIFGASPLVCAGGSLADLWDARERTISFVLFATVSYVGPVAGPIVGGWIVETGMVSWRWTEWVTLIGSGFITCLVVLFLPETFSPVLLRWKAQRMRDATGDARYQSIHDADHNHSSITDALAKSLARPFTLVITEWIVLLFTVYLTIVYIILYTFLGGYTDIFGKTYSLNTGLVGTCFVGIFVGLCIVWLTVPFVWKVQQRELKHDQEQDVNTIRPELRLWFSMLGGAVAIPAGLFWMAWTAIPSISIASALVASVLFGYGILCVWITAYQYIIDSYENYAASALAGMTAVRYLCAGGMTIVGVPFYANLGIHYTLTILACLSALMVPIPYLLYFYGPKVRERSKYAAKHCA